MRKTAGRLFGITTLVTIVVIISNLYVSDEPNRPLLQYSGILAISAMSIAMVLATRARWLEVYTGGLDKGYHLHKWLGITTLIGAVFHWTMSEFPELFGASEEEDEDGDEDGEGEEGSFDFSEIDYTSVEGFLESFESPAHTFGEYAFYAIILLILIALIKRIPYHIFRMTHKIIPIFYLALAFHAVILMKFEYWITLTGPLTAALLIAGSYSAILILLGFKGKAAKCKGTIALIQEHTAMNTVEVVIEPSTKWQGHHSGQFAFLTLNNNKEPHPFTISSAWNLDFPHISFTIKSLGDYTNNLRKNISVGDSVTIEGPYGHFNFACSNNKQIWIAGGIGITPFLAQLEFLAKHGNNKSIDLFYVAKDIDVEFIENLERLSQKAEVTLHHFTNNNNARLRTEDIQQRLPEWRTASVWFCGPKGLGDMLQSDLQKGGLSAQNFHREIFDLR
ncbi:MAG: ferredoxin reductase family protein [Alphaproteobacteria bacterium]